MINKFILICMLAIGTVGCSAEEEKPKAPKKLYKADIRPKEKAYRYFSVAGKLSNELEYRFMQFYPARAWVKGGGLVLDVAEVSLGFNVFCPPTIEDTRLIILDLYDLCFDLYNNDEEIRPYLHNYPFGPDNVCLSINPVDQKGQQIMNGKDVWKVVTKGRTLRYSSTTLKLAPAVNIHEETIEDARAIIAERAARGDLPW